MIVLLFCECVIKMLCINYLFRVSFWLKMFVKKQPSKGWFLVCEHADYGWLFVVSRAHVAAWFVSVGYSGHNVFGE